MSEPMVPTDMGFAEFTSKLMEEVFEAVAAAEAEQRQKLAELNEIAGMNPLEYGRRFIDEAAVSEAIESLFPSGDPKRPTTVYEGASYRAPTDNETEYPPILEQLGLRIEKSHLRTRRAAAPVLNQHAVAAVRLAIRERIAGEQLARVAAAVEGGVPRIVVEGGRINAKLTFQVVTAVAADPRKATPARGQRELAPGVSGFPRLPFGRLAGLQGRSQLEDVRLVVTQASRSDTKIAQATANVFGEVEIQFKTIT